MGIVIVSEIKKINLVNNVCYSFPLRYSSDACLLPEFNSMQPHFHEV